ncbi:hypothetical protein HO151_06605, partial [Streptomyces sp. 8P21H-1]|nr:hypothetical protein [Streptomyces sp. 8P21H-1]
MSRETDSSSSGPNGRGGTAYPSGTPPYGTPMASDAAADRPEQPKTETTLTTRIRINIPGSRPIPPVVVRKPVANGESSDATGASQAPASDAGPTAGPAASAGGSADPDTGSHALPAGTDGGGSGGEKASDWFAPRKTGAPKG